jgi:hypothetical protein
MVVTLVGIALVGAVLLRPVLSANGPDQGPLIDRSHTRQSASAARDPGVAVSYGILYVTNEAPSPAVLRAVVLHSQSPGLHLLGSYVIEPGHPGLGVVDGFHPGTTEGAHPMEGYAVRTGRDTEIVLGLAARRGGSFFFRSIGVSYEVNGKTYKATFPYAFHLCSPEAKFAGKCPSSLQDIST